MNEHFLVKHGYASKALCIGLVMLLYGCGSGDVGEALDSAIVSNPEANAHYVFTGKVYSGYEDGQQGGSYVCLDIYSDDDCDSESQPIDASGNYKITIVQAALSGKSQVVLLAKLDTSGQNTPTLATVIPLANGELSYTDQNITSATSLVWAKSATNQAIPSGYALASTQPSNAQANYQQAVDAVAAFLDIEKSHVFKHPRSFLQETSNPQLFQQSIKVTKAVEYLKSQGGGDTDKALYQALIQGEKSDGSQAMFDEVVSITMPKGESLDVAEPLDSIDAEVREIDSLAAIEHNKAILLQNGRDLVDAADKVDAIAKEAHAKGSLDEDAIKARNDSLASVTSNLYLPKWGKYRTRMIWISSNPAVISPSGVVVRPAIGEPPVEVELQYTIFKVAGSQQGVFRAVVQPLKQQLDNAAKVEKDYQWLSYAVLNTKKNINRQKTIANLYFPTEGKEGGSAITWASDNPAITIDGTLGVVTRDQRNDALVKLTATISHGDASRKKHFLVMVPSHASFTNADVLAEALLLLTDTTILGSNTALNQIQTNLTLPVDWYYGSSIVWSSNDASAITATGIVSRARVQKLVTLTATISLPGHDVAYKKTFTITVQSTNIALLLDTAKSQITFASIRLNNLGETAITSDVYLYQHIANGIKVDWSSNNTSVISNAGFVTRPAQDTPVKLTATLSKDGYSKTVVFDLLVLGTQASTSQAFDKDGNLLNFSLIAGANTSPDQITHKLRLINTAPYGTPVTWHIDRPMVITPFGYIIRPNEDTQVTVTATLTDTLTNAVWIKKFHLTVLARTPVATNNDFAQAVVDTDGNAVAFTMRLYGKAYTVKPRSNVVMRSNIFTDAINLDFSFNGKQHPNSIAIAASYLRSNMRFAIYPANAPSDAEPIFMSSGHFINSTQQRIKLHLEGDYVTEYLPPDPPDWGLGFPLSPLAF